MKLTYGALNPVPNGVIKLLDSLSFIAYLSGFQSLKQMLNVYC